jgi:hypothetical protein
VAQHGGQRQWRLAHFTKNNVRVAHANADDAEQHFIRAGLIEFD